MTQFISLVLSGAVTGAIYSIMASGLVLTYTTTGIFNFAHGAVAFAVAYLYYQLHAGLGIPIAPAVILSVFVFGPLLGLGLDWLLLRRLSRAPVYAKIVGTIGLLLALPNLMQWLVVTVGNQVFHLGLIGNSAINQNVPAPGHRAHTGARIPSLARRGVEFRSAHCLCAVPDLPQRRCGSSCAGPDWASK